MANFTQAHVVLVTDSFPDLVFKNDVEVFNVFKRKNTACPLHVLIAASIYINICVNYTLRNMPTHKHYDHTPECCGADLAGVYNAE